MSTFLELVQQTAEDSGTAPFGSAPSTVTSQSGRNLQFVNWVRRAWKDVQRARSDWRWMEAEFSGSTVASTREYQSSDLGISSRFARWLHHDDLGDDTFSLYLPANGQSTEGYLCFLDWPDFRRICQIGSSATREGKPHYITVTPERKLAFYPTPDDAYTLRGRYMRSPQTLTEDGDIPEMPDQFHQIIVWRALDLLVTHDEAFEQRAIFRQEYQRILSELVVDQTPRLIRADPLA